MDNLVRDVWFPDAQSTLNSPSHLNFSKYDAMSMHTDSEYEINDQNGEIDFEYSQTTINMEIEFVDEQTYVENISSSLSSNDESILSENENDVFETSTNHINVNMDEGFNAYLRPKIIIRRLSNGYITTMLKSMKNRSLNENTEIDNEFDEVIFADIDEFDGPEIIVGSELNVIDENSSEILLRNRYHADSWEFQPKVIVERLTEEDIIRLTSNQTKNAPTQHNSTLEDFPSIVFDNNDSVIHEISPKSAFALHRKVITYCSIDKL